ncbi:MAG TPA: hypothetical protein VMV93_07535 [Chloroflexota bacterium]|nr:hypothetical protein [Chloroflexota bacterium]
MAPSSEPLEDILSSANDLADAVTAQVSGLAYGQACSRQALESVVLSGLGRASEAVRRLSQALDSAQLSLQPTAGFSAALAMADQRLAFFQGCTMRRSSAHPPAPEAEQCAEAAEQRAQAACASGAMDRLVEAYKALEGLEARVAEIRAASASPSGAPEPRVLDLPRARILVARRAIGSAIVARDDDADD